MREWCAARLGDLVSIVGGGTPTRTNPDYYGGQIPWVTPKDMKSHYINKSLVTLTQSGLGNSVARLVPANSILIVVRSGVLKHTVPVGINTVPVAINQDMKALSCSERIDPRFLARFVKARSAEILQWVRATTADNLPIDKLRELNVPVPPISEQLRIAEILERADALCAKRREALTQLDELTQSIFLDMFDSSRGIPVSSLGEHLSFVTSGGRGWARFYADRGKRFIRSIDVRMNKVDDREAVYVNPPDNAEARRTAMKAGDVLLTITGSRIGRVSAVPEELDGAHVSQHVAILRPSRGQIRPEYLSFFLSLRAGGQRQIASAQYGQTKPGLNFQQIREFKIPAPAISLQDKFAERVAGIESIKNANRVHLAELDALFASLQHRAFRGEL